MNAKFPELAGDDQTTAERRGSVEAAMRAVLLQMALTSNGATANWNPRGTGEIDPVPRLGHGDAPHEHYARLFDQAPDGNARAAVLERARAELHAIRHAQRAVIVGESREELDRRIVEYGEGIAARDVAVRARCSVRDVWRARAAAGRDADYGRPIPEGDGKVARRRAEALRLVGQGASVAHAADVLGVSVKTIRRYVGAPA